MAAISAAFASESAIGALRLAWLCVLARRDEAHHLVDTGSKRPLGAARVGTSRGDMGFAATAQPCQHVMGVGELRHRARTDERRRFDVAQAGGNHRID